MTTHDDDDDANDTIYIFPYCFVDGVCVYVCVRDNSFANMKRFVFVVFELFFLLPLDIATPFARKERKTGTHYISSSCLTWHHDCQ